MKKQMLMYGGPANGFTFVGPFDDADDAIAYAEDNRIQDSWWVVDLVAPNEVPA
jgi:hypothetical protein